MNNEADDPQRTKVVQKSFEYYKSRLEMPAVAEVILILLFVQGKRNQEALEAKKKREIVSTNKHKNSNKRCIVLATGERGALEEGS